MSTNGSYSNQEQYAAPTEQPAASNNSQPANEEVGWLFVESYYNTLSKFPEKLHLFYNKRSQFVCGEEAEVSNVAVGRTAIEERIRQLKFHDCKVRVANVDTLSSGDNIVVQVIGETSNNQEPPRKFVQTFVLAKQTSGYFVLNDIWRFIIEDDDVVEGAEAAIEEPVAEEAPVEETPVTAEPEVAAEPAAVEEPVVEAAPEPSPELVPEPIEEKASEEPIVAAEPEVVEEKTPEPVAAPKDEEESKVAAPEVSKAEEPAAAPASKEETPAPAPAPVPVPVPAPAPAPIAAPVPAAAPVAKAPEPARPAPPMTWANRVAVATDTGAKASVPAPKASVTAAPSAKATPTSAASSKPAAAAAPSPATQPAPAQATDASSGSEWQTAGNDSKRQNRPQSTASGDKESFNAYVKSVSDKVSDVDLKNALSQYGRVTYCDINRVKNCAFVDFATLEAYKAAENANPHIINGESINVEPRKPKSNSYGNYGNSGYSGRSGMNRGRGGYDNRGGYNTHRGFGRGRGGSSRGRGGAQMSNA
ncbi:hypothetical protein TD95_003818 [Thielaviopsis punctulata]|uniref:NTF2 domain-containing protein n=1 Tax=Thielaviopsis punctulata TaxID=72032 RepID=A0A0F4ZGU3_9PEZI|nr:hypothetical protein TD95_003818 [Thielaviopsis punctulata]